MQSSFYSPDELAALGIKTGAHVQLSRNAKIYGTDIELGDMTRIDDGCILMGKIRLGKRVHIAPYCLLYGKRGITIGDYSGFGAFSCFHSESDDYGGESMFGPQVPEWLVTRKDRGPIVIGKGVIGGVRCSYLPNITLGDGASIGAHSLVKEDCDEWTLYAGTPAKVIRRNVRTAEKLWGQLETLPC